MMMSAEGIEGATMAEWPTPTATAGGLATDEYEREWRRAVAASLKELLTAMQQLREQNASYEAHRQETDKRLDKMELRMDKNADTARESVMQRLKQRVEWDWKLATACGSVALWLVQFVVTHASITLH